MPLLREKKYYMKKYGHLLVHCFFIHLISQVKPIKVANHFLIILKFSLFTLRK